ncbi:thiolase-like protein [Aspergillus parasiticus]|uniref:Thiolase-like protein n=1 Tax=Aspergillus parasiticus TaxID=5067 RepID=A0A5N6DM05_ASPPA|nr:thiolase-like protein [Aspergillus parasiticus]
MQFFSLQQKYHAVRMELITRWRICKQACRQIFRKDELSSPSISVVGMATQYGTTLLQRDFLEELLSRHCRHSPAVSETLDRIERSGIRQLCSVLPLDDPIWSQQTLPTIADADALFKEHAIPLVCRAAKGAITEWGGSMYNISHVIAVTSTNTANPGFDITLCSTLGLRPTVHRTLLYGLGCAGGLSALRIAYDLLAGAALQGLPARALVVSCDLPTLFARAELHRINVDQEVGFGLSRFSDGTTVLERGPIWNLLGFRSVIIKESEGYNELSIGPFGFKAIISTFIPRLVSSELFSNFTALVNSVPGLRSDKTRDLPNSYNWASDFPGRSALKFAQGALDLKKSNLSHSDTVYRSRGSTISCSVLNILNYMRHHGNGGDHLVNGRNKVIALAIGPGIILEMAVLHKASTADLRYAAHCWEW